MKLRIGDRVRVSPSYHWARGQAGVVVSTGRASFGGGLLAEVRRRVRMSLGKEDVWIKFDEPQIDGDGDGPYTLATVERDALERLS